MSAVTTPAAPTPADISEPEIATDWPARLGNPLLWLGAILTAASYLRFRGLSAQSFWFDESVSVTLVRRSFGAMINQIPESESTPPLYYVLAWLWTHIFGSGEAGVRSLSALFGVATIGFVYLAARQLIGTRAAVFAAIIVTFNPMLVWYSQEARAYALLVLLGAVSFWLAARIATGGPTRKLIWLWTAASAAALLTHYFAFFIVAAEAVWLYRSLDMQLDALKRPLIAMLVLCAFVLAPLAAHGERDGRTAWIATTPMNERVRDVQKELLNAGANIVSSNSKLPDGKLWPPLAFIAVVTGLVVALRTTDPRYRVGARAALAVAASAIAAPWVLSILGIDFFKDRNLIAGWIPWFIGVAAGLACLKRGWIGVIAVAVIAIAGLSVCNLVQERPYLQRSNWRAAIQAIPPSSEPTLLALEPYFSQAPLRVYGLQPKATKPGVQRTRRFTILGMLSAQDPRFPQRIGAFRFAEQAQYEEIGSVTYVADTPSTLDAAALKRLGVRDLRELLVVAPTTQ